MYYLVTTKGQYGPYPTREEAERQKKNYIFITDNKDIEIVKK
jgi:hypothetical protein